MFRGSKPSELSPKNFGAGSTIEGSPGEKWLVVNEGDRAVTLADMQHFGMVGRAVSVEDPNWLTEEQARRLVALIDDCYTFSDYTLDPKGIKK